MGVDELYCVVFFLMLRRPPISTRTDTLFPYTTLFRSASYPERVFAAVPIASAARHSAQNIAFHEVGRQAIYSDPDWREGGRSEEHTSELQSLMRISYAVFCLKKKRQQK